MNNIYSSFDHLHLSVRRSRFIIMQKITPALIIAINDALEEEDRSSTQRNFAVHPYMKKREEKGQFNIMYEELRRFPEKFFGYFKMSVKTFDELLNVVKSDLEKKPNIKGDTIPAVERLSITLK